jgi:hypothetical protein
VKIISEWRSEQKGSDIHSQKRIAVLPLCVLILFTSQVLSHDKTEVDLQKGVNLIETKVHPDEDNARILKLHESLRVADVSDGMDMAGLPGRGLVDPAIHAAWLNEKNLSHQFNGVIVVPRANAEDVAKYAQEILDKHKDARTQLYQKAGLPTDRTVNK